MYICQNYAGKNRWRFMKKSNFEEYRDELLDNLEEAIAQEQAIKKKLEYAKAKRKQLLEKSKC